MKYSTRTMAALLMIVAMAAAFTACSDDKISDPPSKHIIGIWYDEQNGPGLLDIDGEKIIYYKVVQYASFKENGEGFWSIIFVDEDGHAIDIPNYFCGGSFLYADKSNESISIKINSAGIPILQDSWDVLYSDGRLHVDTSEIDHDMTPITEEQNKRVQKWLRELGLGGFNMVDIATLQSDYVAQDGDVLTGTLSGNYKISIANDAIVTLDGVTIDSSGAGIKCEGNATIILADDSTNKLTSTGSKYSALTAGPYETTLTIQGSTGVLVASSGQYCSGIGGGYEGKSGNVVIQGGVITATGGHSAPGIGSGMEADCGDITIGKGITKVTVTKGANADVIGTGDGNSHCMLITFGEGRNSRVCYDHSWTRTITDGYFGGLTLTITEYRDGIQYSWMLEPAS